MSDLDSLRAHLSTMGRVVLGLLGWGRFRAAGGRRTPGAWARAIPGRHGTESVRIPRARRSTAPCWPSRFDIPVLEIETHELEDPRYLSNSTGRCYFCKSELWSRLQSVAQESGVRHDCRRNQRGRPRASTGPACAPRRSTRCARRSSSWAGPSRGAERRAALGLPIWDAPAAPCLSSRVRYGLEITPATGCGKWRRVKSYLRTRRCPG